MLNVFLTQLENTVLYIQDREGLFQILFIVLSMLLSAVLSSFIFHDDKKLIVKIIGTYVLITAAVFLISLGAVALIFHLKPQQDSFCNLFRRIIRVNGKDYLIPLLISFAAGLFVNWVVARKRATKVASCIVIGLSAILSSIMFFFNAFQLVQRPNYNVPTEAVASVVNSRLNVYPMALSSVDLQEIEERHKPSPKPEKSNGDNQEDGTDGGQESDIPEPTSFGEYISAAIRTNGTDEQEHYLRRAYQLFSAGKHDNDYFDIGIMWYFLALSDWFLDIDYKECSYNSIEAYQKCEESGNISEGLYSNMILAYGLTQNIKGIRSCLQKALQLDENGENIQSRYQSYVYQWMETESLNVLMKDAGVIIDYSVEHNSKVPIAMCVLYGACAADTSKNLSEANDYLSKADKQYKGKDPMVKILKCICEDMLGTDASDSLPAIYKLEKKSGGLSSVEELYLIRYLHATGKYDALWGYIADVGAAMSDSDDGSSDVSDGSDDTDASGQTNISDGSNETNGSEDPDAADELGELEDADIEKAAIKAEWYFKNQLITEENVKGAERLHELISNRLQRGELGKKDEKILRLSKLLLGSCLGIAETSDSKFVDAGEIEEVSDIAYVFLAVNAFNEEKYKKAISYCNKFFDAERNLKKKSTTSASGFSLKELEAQEQVVLHYHMQLIYAHSHFEYAKTAKKDSKEWKKHMNKAKKICIDFEDSSKSLFMIREQFHILRGSIDSENGEISSKDETVIKEQDL